VEKVLLPELGEDIEKATVACWHKKIGDEISIDDDILEVVTDKATFNVSAGANGVLKDILFKEGDEVMIGETLAIIEPVHQS